MKSPRNGLWIWVFFRGRWKWRRDGRIFNEGEGRAGWRKWRTEKGKKKKKEEREINRENEKRVGFGQFFN